MSLPLDSIICGDNVQVLRGFPAECIDLTVTSPPYDGLRKYGGHTWDFEGVAQELWRVTKPGGVLVWVVGDATVNGSETGTSFRQALRFMEVGFKLHDTMIYAKEIYLPRNHNRYEQQFEYMFVLTKGTPQAFHPMTIPCAEAGQVKQNVSRHENHAVRGRSFNRVTKDTKIRPNIWFYRTGFNMTTKDKQAFEHPALFPEKLAADHITSWSNPGDLVLDPFSGSGTTAKMAAAHGRRYIGIEVSEEYCDIARGRLQDVQSTLGA